MLFNFEWLKENEEFPPKSELKRIKGYKDNFNLFMDEPSLVLESYVKRFKQIVNSLDDNGAANFFLDTPNYWQLSTIKTVDLMVGDKPTITCEKASDKLESVLQDTKFYEKLNELVIDVDSLGECLLRPYINSKRQRDFVSQSPEMWFPIVNPENIKEIIADVICWTVCTKQDANNSLKNEYELHCKIQQRGASAITFRRYKVPKFYECQDYVDRNTFEHFGKCTFFKIGRLLEETQEQAPYTQLVINISNVTTSKTIHGISNYERITSLVAELSIRQCLASFILDQNSAPRMAAPSGAFDQNEEGNWVLKTGGRNFVVKPQEAPPVYITWDGNLTSNEERIKDIKQTLYSMCEVGSIVNQDEINSSQGYEALQVKLTNAKLKVRRMSATFIEPLKQLLAYLIDNKVDEKEINVLFNEGIPMSSTQNINEAQAKVNLGFSKHSVFKEYFGLTSEQADDEIEKAKEESVDAFVNSFGAGRNGLFGGGQEPNKPQEPVKEPNGE